MSSIPASSNVMLGGIMLGFFSLCMVITFQAPLIWWSVPLICAAAVVVLATIRVRRHRRMRAELHGARL
jgi:hypothetical protein